MLSILQTRYQRVEKALNTLIDSITAYNPSITAAEELVAADDEVSEGLEEREYTIVRAFEAVDSRVLVTKHHTNYGRILALRQTANALDEQIKSTARLLSETRKQLLAIPSPPSDDDTRDVRVDELLSYAKFISKTTVPPTFRRDAPAVGALKEAIGAKSEERHETQITNGMATPAANTQDGDTQAMTQSTEGIGVSRLNDEIKAMLDPISQLPFVPWPSQEVISMGALAHVQSMLEQGRDPTTILSAEEQELEDRRRAEEEEKRKAEEEERLRRRRESMMAVGGLGRQSLQEEVFDPDEI